MKMYEYYSICVNIFEFMCTRYPLINFNPRHYFDTCVIRLIKNCVLKRKLVFKFAVKIGQEVIELSDVMIFI